MDYFSSDAWTEPERGDLLVSEPYLPDPNFVRSVILICEHDENGTFGFVLNQLSQAVFSDAVEGIQNFDAPLYVGGPVKQNSLHFIHKRSDQLASKEIIPGLFWGGDFDRLLSLIDTGSIDQKDYRFFVGYSGWESGQLEDELKEKAWMIYKNPSAEIIFNTSPDQLWQQVLKNKGGKYKVIANYPQDPRLN